MQDLPENGTAAHSNDRSVSDPKCHTEDPLETVVKSSLKETKSARLKMEDGGKVSPSRWSIRNISHELREKLCGGWTCCSCCPLERKTKTMVVATLVICLSMGSYFLATSLQNVTISDSSDLSPAIGNIGSGIYYTSSGLGSLAFPLVSKRLGRRTMYSIALTLYTMLYVAMFWISKTTVYVGSALAGLGGSNLFILGLQSIADNSERDLLQRNMGYFWAAVSLSNIINNLVNFFFIQRLTTITTTIRLGVYGTLASLALVALVLVLLGMDEEKEEEGEVVENTAAVEGQRRRRMGVSEVTGNGIAEAPNGRPRTISEGVAVEEVGNGPRVSTLSRSGGSPILEDRRRGSRNSRKVSVIGLGGSFVIEESDEMVEDKTGATKTRRISTITTEHTPKAATERQRRSPTLSRVSTNRRIERKISVMSTNDITSTQNGNHANNPVLERQSSVYANLGSSVAERYPTLTEFQPRQLPSPVSRRVSVLGYSSSIVVERESSGERNERKESNRSIVSEVISEEGMELPDNEPEAIQESRWDQVREGLIWLLALAKRRSVWVVVCYQFFSGTLWGYLLKALPVTISVTFELRSVINLSGLVVGFATLVGALTFKKLRDLTNNTFCVFLMTVLCVSAAAFSYLIFPWDGNINQDSVSPSYIQPQTWHVVLISVALALSDTGFNVLGFSVAALMFSGDSAVAFSFLNVTFCLGNGVMMVLSGFLNLHAYLILLAVLTVMTGLGYSIVLRKYISIL